MVGAVADTLNALMAIPNLIALLALSGVVVAETRKFLWNNNIDAAGDDGEPATAGPEPEARD